MVPDMATMEQRIAEIRKLLESRSTHKLAREKIEAIRAERGDLPEVLHNMIDFLNGN
tara:strand:- start:14187 stop:14357 length:171 start_codon:yes stop_codon:yes gene_type:complete